MLLKKFVHPISAVVTICFGMLLFLLWSSYIDQTKNSMFPLALKECHDKQSTSACNELIKFQVSPVLYKRTDTPYKTTVDEYANAIVAMNVTDENRIDGLVAYTYHTASKHDIELSQRYTEKWPKPVKD